MSARPRLRTLFATLAVAAAALTLPVAPSTAAGPLPEPPDFASEAYGDAWDFSEPTDWRLDTDLAISPTVLDASISGGTFNARFLPRGEIDPVFTVPGAIPWGRDGAHKPVNAERYTRLAFRMYSANAGSGGFFWFSCQARTPSCWGGMPLTIRAGWNTYDVPIATGFGTGAGAPRQPWAGNLVGLRFQPPGVSGGNQVHLDWMRVYAPVAGSAPGGTPPEQTNLRPRPALLDPDAAGGADYAETVRRDGWDMSSPSDVLSSENVRDVSFSGGVLSATNSAPTRNDPFVSFPLAGPVDGSTYHRMTFRYRYDGPFSLGDFEGGGTMTRLLWQVAGTKGFQVLEDVVTYPGWNDVTIDLAGPLGSIVDDGTVTPVGWAGRQVTSVRFDPNEDRGARRWHLDSLRLAADDQGTDTFDIRFTDAAWESGTTADLYVDSDAAGFDGTRIATDVPVTAGVNTFRWTNSTLPNGTYWVYLVLDDGTTTAAAYSTGPVRMQAPVDPFGSLDGIRRVPGGVAVGGWAMDPSTRTSPIDVHLYVDGRFAAAVPASQSRPDLAAAFPGYGGAHGYSTTLATGPGAHEVCVYGINTGAGTNTLLSCGRTVVAVDPFGSVDTAARAPGGVTVAGWALDPDSASSVGVHAYVDGRLVSATTASATRDDIAAAFPGYGSAHGYRLQLPVPAGVHDVCLYALNAGPGANQGIGCRRVDVGVEPFGSLDAVPRSGGSVTASGWAIDPDTADPVDVHLYVDGRFAAAVTAAASRPDVGRAFGYGDAHGYAVPLTAPAGSTVCAYAINRFAGSTNPSLGCRRA